MCVVLNLPAVAATLDVCDWLFVTPPVSVCQHLPRYPSAAQIKRMGAEEERWRQYKQELVQTVAGRHEGR